MSAGMRMLPAIFEDAALERGLFVITTDPEVAGFFWKFPNAEVAGSRCALLPKDIGFTLFPFSNYVA